MYVMTACVFFGYSCLNLSVVKRGIIRICLQPLHYLYDHGASSTGPSLLKFCEPDVHFYLTGIDFEGAKEEVWANVATILLPEQEVVFATY